MYSYPADDDDASDAVVEPGTYDNDNEGHDEDTTHLSPTDGYFRASSETATSGTWDSEAYRPSDHVPSSPSRDVDAGFAGYTPHVPDVWVQDPSLVRQQEGGGSSTAADKAREAEEERSANAPSGALNSSTTSGSTPARSATGFYHGRHQHLQQQLPSAARDNLALAYDSPTATYNTSPPSSRYAPSSRADTGGHSQYTPSTSSSGRFYPHHHYHHHHHQHSNSGASSVGAGSSSGRAFSERSSLLPSEAPPAYTPSATTTASNSGDPPTSPTARAAGSTHAYSTFLRSPAMGRRDEARGLLAGHPPESMGGDPDDVSGGDVEMAWRERVRRRVPFVNGRNCRMVGLALVLLLMTVGFLTVPGVPNDRVTRPPSDGPVSSPDAPPSGNYPAFDGGLDLFKSCTAAKYEYPLKQFGVDFSSTRDLRIEQKIDETDDHGTRTRYIRTSGDVVFRRTTTASSDPSITLEMVSSSDAIVVGIDYSEDRQALVITTPRAVAWDDTDREWPCLNVRVTVWVPGDGGGSSLNRLQVDVVHLGVKLLDNLALRVGDYTRLGTTVGPVAAAVSGSEDEERLARSGPPASFAFDSRFIEVKTTSARIYGSWPLYDYLVLESMSGNVRAGVVPKPALAERPLPAKLRVKTVSGNAEVWEPVGRAAEVLAERRRQERSGRMVAVDARPEDVIPPRDYAVEVSSTSGDMSGALAFGGAGGAGGATFHSTSGKLSVDLLPVLPAALAQQQLRGQRKQVGLETSTTSGNAAVRVLEPLWTGEDGDGNAAFVPGPVPIGDRDPYDVLRPEEEEEEAAAAKAALRVLQARHTSTSANLVVRYPKSWEGWITGQSMSGTITLRGEGITVVREGKDWPGVYKKVVARKGSVGEGEASSVEVKSTSGDLTVAIGTE
ncbi:uncharacterized protein E0L32_010485 [Thyridium curvatum]|uniref:Uncharacterized protein n=1 Tax=Thyridium curvatum TaxID=1093900 RepID=A0A507ASE3_9PEZI|nr:uncharacterized protein E0L32_010485 [Thyridium curvatum]TPX07798.1 hypothetical protein E0L32_010485 [Thyridium curvatum]